jgi:Zn-dependent protease
MNLSLIPFWYVVFLFSTVCHEAAHALVAKWGGDSTAYASGQVSLDPIPHIKREPFGLVVIPLLTLFSSAGGGLMGWGSAPYNPLWQIRYPRRAALMALAGPLTNFSLAIIVAVIIRIGLITGVFGIPEHMTSTHLISAGDSPLWDGVAILLSIMFVLNVILGVFNLIPFPPLDGYTVLGLFLPERITLKMLELARSPGFSLLGLFIMFNIFPKMSGVVLRKAIELLFLF